MQPRSHCRRRSGGGWWNGAVLVKSWWGANQEMVESFGRAGGELLESWWRAGGELAKSWFTHNDQAHLEGLATAKSCVVSAQLHFVWKSKQHLTWWVKQRATSGLCWATSFGVLCGNAILVRKLWHGCSTVRLNSSCTAHVWQFVLLKTSH